MVDRLMEDWLRVQPDVEAEGLGVTSRIVLLGKAFAREYRRVLAPLGVSPAACEVLLALRRQGPPYQLTPTDLGKMTLLTSGAMTTRLDRMEEASLVRRNPDPDDRRSLQVSLTEMGRQLADRVLEARLAMVDTLLAPLSAEERQLTTSLLRKLLVGLRLGEPA